MIPLSFFRDKTHVYINNPDGITKQMTIAEFEAMLNGSGGGDESGGIMKVVGVYDSELHAVKLDKTYTEITSAMADGKIVILCESYLAEDESISFASTGYVSTGGVDAEEDEENPYNYIDIVTTSVDVVIITRYAEDNGNLVYHRQHQIPQPTYQAFTYMSNTLYASGKQVFTALSSIYCFFTNASAGTNKERRYMATEYGKDGSTYYVVLSNGDRFEGGDTGNMTKVAVNP